MMLIAPTQTSFLLLNNTTNNPENTGTTALYNGNISETHWRSQNIETQKRSYAYDYDALNRIKAADYLTPHAMTGLFKGDENYSLSNIEYDYNGNIKTLHRYGATVSNDIDYIDKLVYDYKPLSNQLNKVDDTAGENGFKDGDHQKDYDYKYDINGNMIQDLNKDIATIEYNHLNLPTKVIFNTSGYQNREISYLYDATGVKLEKIVNTGTFSDGSSAGLGMITHTQYDGGFIYKYTGTSTPELTFFSHPEGYIEPDNQGSYDYVYQFKDHLGNIRLSYKNVGTSTNPVLDIIEEKNYYPFGLKHKGYNNATSGNVNSVASKFEYNGKELNDELGLNWYDFGARNYDATLGRWMNVDPLADIAPDRTPYHFVSNNPINRIDPDGLTDYEINSKGEIVKTIENKEADNFYVVDDDGNRLEGQSITFDYGTIESHRSQSGTYQKRNDDGTRSEEVTTIDILKVRGDENGTKLFEFFADNTNVEWSHAKTGIEGDKGLNFLTSGHIEYTEPGIAALINGQLSGGYTIRELNHNHPGGTAVPSGIPGLTGNTGDVSFAKAVTEWYERTYPNRSSSPTYNIYVTGKPYIPYSKDSKKEDYGY